MAMAHRDDYLKIDKQPLFNDDHCEKGQGDSISWRTASSLQAEESSQTSESSSKSLVSTPRSVTSSMTDYMELPLVIKCKCSQHHNNNHCVGEGERVVCFVLSYIHLRIIDRCL